MSATLTSSILKLDAQTEHCPCPAAEEVAVFTVLAQVLLLNKCVTHFAPHSLWLSLFWKQMKQLHLTDEPRGQQQVQPSQRDEVIHGICWPPILFQFAYELSQAL